MKRITHVENGVNARALPRPRTRFLVLSLCFECWKKKRMLTTKEQETPHTQHIKRTELARCSTAHELFNLADYLFRSCYFLYYDFLAWYFFCFVFNFCCLQIITILWHAGNCNRIFNNFQWFLHLNPHNSPFAPRIFCVFSLISNRNCLDKNANNPNATKEWTFEQANAICYDLKGT